MIISEGQIVRAVRSESFPTLSTISALPTADRCRFVLEPRGTMPLPPTHVGGRLAANYAVRHPIGQAGRQKLPVSTPYPELSLSVVQDAFCLPNAPPLLGRHGQIVTDYLVPWTPQFVPWFTLETGDVYRSNATLDTEKVAHDLDVVFYLDHAISMHYGHFVGDCLPRLYGLEVLRDLFSDIKVLIAGHPGTEFQNFLLNAAGIPDWDIVPFTAPVRCRRLILATCALSVEIYTSPTAARLWGTLRDCATRRDVALPDRIYLSRAAMSDRKMVNETAVEQLFAQQGFTIIRPEELAIERQLALAANALLIAGPGGSGMFNLAFQGRMRSAFVLMWEQFVLTSELLFCAGHGCAVHYHIGGTMQAGGGDRWAADLPRLADEISAWVRTTF